MTKKDKQEMEDLLSKFREEDRKWTKDTLWTMLTQFHEEVSKPTMEMMINNEITGLRKDLGGRINKVGERLSGVEEELGDVRQRLANLDKKFDYYKEDADTRLDKHEERIDKLESAVVA